MTDGVLLRGSAIALGVAAFVSMAALSQAHADVAAAPATVSASQPSLDEPAPTPGWAEAGPQSGSDTAAAEGSTTQVPTPAQRPTTQRYVAHHPYRYAHRYNNPVVGAARGVVGGVADLGAAVTYPAILLPALRFVPGTRSLSFLSNDTRRREGAAVI